MARTEADTTQQLPLRESVARDLRGRIISGDLAPGERLREEPLALSYDVSRVPAREALHLLAQEGFVDLVPRKGATVAFPSARRTRELMVVRETLEVLAAGLAAKRWGGDVAEQFTDVVRRGTEAVEREAYPELPALIDRFHDLVGDASGNRELARMVRATRLQVRWIYEMELERRSAVSWQHHHDIAKAILAGDQEEAEAAMRADVTRDLDLLFDLLMARSERGT